MSTPPWQSNRRCSMSGTLRGSVTPSPRRHGCVWGALPDVHSRGTPACPCAAAESLALLLLRRSLTMRFATSGRRSGERGPLPLDAVRDTRGDDGGELSEIMVVRDGQAQV